MHILVQWVNFSFTGIFCVIQFGLDLVSLKGVCGLTVCNFFSVIQPLTAKYAHMRMCFPPLNWQTIGSTQCMILPRLFLFCSVQFSAKNTFDLFWLYFLAKIRTLPGFFFILCPVFFIWLRKVSSFWIVLFTFRLNWSQAGKC